MENKGRVLAYSKAKEIDESKLLDVSGGANMSHHETLRPTGSTGNMEGFVDVTIDW